MSEWPAAADVAAWARIQPVGGLTVADSAVMADDVATARDEITAQVDPTQVPSDGPTCPAPVRRAIIMRAAQLYAERFAGGGQGPDGTNATGPRYSAEIRRLIRPYALGPSAECG